MKVLVTGGSGFIGSHLLRRLAVARYDVLNVDLVPPAFEERNVRWVGCSILDSRGLSNVFREYAPNCVIHLAAYASMEAKTLDEFRVNIDGTANVLACVKACAGVSRLVITSTQHVRKPGSGFPKDGQDFVPYGLYGESKVRAEQLTRDANLACGWTIVRPTTVWGVGSPLAAGVWRLIQRGLYFHPTPDPVVRSYGYVENVVWQLERILDVPLKDVNRRVLYVGDSNIPQEEWIDAFAAELTGKRAKRLPVEAIRILSHVGDCVRGLGFGFPMYSSRFYNLTTDNAVPIEGTQQVLGVPPFSLADGVKRTCAWLRSIS